MLSSQRITALDLARFFAMIMMIQGHTIDAIASRDFLNIHEFPWNVWNFLRGFTAQVFLIVSGMVHVFANKRLENGKLKPETIKKRLTISFLLIGIGYLLMFPANNIWGLFLVDYKLWLPFFRINILQLIGVSLLMMLASFVLTKNDKQLRILALLLSLTIFILSPFVHSINWFNYLPEFFASYLSFEHGSLFPLFPYSGFMFFGLFLGTIIKQVPSEKRTISLIKYFIPSGIIIAISGYFVKLFIFDIGWVVRPQANYGIILYQIGYVMLNIGIIALIYVMTVKFSFYYALFGKRALMVYVLHLFLLYGSPWWESIGKIYYRQLSLEWTLFFVLLIEVLTFGIAYTYEYFLNSSKAFQKYYKKVIMITIGFLLLIGNFFRF